MSDDDKSTLKQWLVSVSIVLALQIGALIWFLADQAGEQRRIARTIDRIEPQHNEVYYFYKQQMPPNGRVAH